jgi:hypothetical protein
MVRVYLDLHDAGDLHLVLLLVIGNVALQLGFKIRIEKVGFLLLQPENGGVVLEGHEVLIAVEQAQAVDRRGIPIPAVVRHLELPLGLIFLAHAHEIDAQFGMRRPELGIEIDRLAVVVDGIPVAIVDFEKMPDDGIGLPVGRIDLFHFRQPLIGRAVRDQFHSGVDRHGVQ